MPAAQSRRANSSSSRPQPQYSLEKPLAASKCARRKDQHGTEEGRIGQAVTVLGGPPRQVHRPIRDAVVTRLVLRQRIHVVKAKHVRFVPVQPKARIQELAAVEGRTRDLLDDDQLERQLVFRKRSKCGANWRRCSNRSR